MADPRIPKRSNPDWAQVLSGVLVLVVLIVTVFVVASAVVLWWRWVTGS